MPMRCNLPDLNPVNLVAKGLVERSLSGLTNLNHAVVAAAVPQWRRCLSACVKLAVDILNIVSESIIVLVD